MDCSSQKLNTSGEKHVCPAIDCSNQKQNASAEKHVLGSVQLQSEPVETMTIGSVAQNCQTRGSSILEQNTPDKKHEMGSKHVSSDPMEIKNLGSVVEEKFYISGNSISKESALGRKPERDFKLVVLGESMETKTAGSNAQQTCHIIESSISEENTLLGKLELDSKDVLVETRTAGSNAQDLQTIDSCHNELCPEVVQGKKMETNIVGSDSVDVGLSGTETMILDTVAQNCQTIGSSILEHEVESEHVSSEPMDIMVVGSDAEEKCHITGNTILKDNMLGGKPEHDSKLALGEPMETSTPGSNAQNFQKVELHSEHVNGEPVEIRMVGSDYVDVGLSGTPPMCATENLNGSNHKESTISSRSKKRKSALTSPGTARVLRPRLNGLCKPPEPTGISVNVSVEKDKKRKKIKRTMKTLDDEFSRTRKRLRYVLTRMGYEQNFIDAYSGEGWKGQSAEKIKPEKELQRATSEILRCKRKIRELFQHLDSSCAEGRFQESLFDSEGQISSEDIFCAKCQSQELSADNDIILCDGICDRGFHQMCLKPPLLKEEIPPGDEGWLCPGCDCKVDCIDTLNDSQGTNLSIDDAWEKVFPEAAATVAGDMTDDISGLPSDDSEDYEYNPDAPEVEEGVDTEGSSSDDSEDSDFTSASDDLGVRPLDDQYLGLPSDDSEDDEYDPNAPDPSDESEDDEYDPNAPDLERTKEDSSSSDFSSASECFSASNDANGSSGREDGPVPASVDCSKLPNSSNRRSKLARSEKQSVNSELLSILEPNSQGDLSSVPRKRQRERLDYKKLHDEEYGNFPSDSSDDEDWAEADAHLKKKDDTVEESSLSPKANSQTRDRRRNTRRSQKKDSDETGNTSKRRKRQKKDSEGVNNLAAETHTDSPELDLVEKKATGSGNKTLGEAITQKLYESFKENQYPTRVAKENLAKDLGITFQQITKWFGNARWSLRQQSNNTISTTKKISPTKDQPCKLVEPENKSLPKDVDCNKDGDQELTEAGTPKTLQCGRDISVDLDHQSSEASSKSGTSKVCPTKNPTPSKLVEPETKIFPNDVDSKKVEDRELSDVGTPMTLGNVRDASDNLESQTVNESSSRTVVISIPANSPKTDQVRRKGRKMNQVATRSQIQTRSRKAPTDK